MRKSSLLLHLLVLCFVNAQFTKRIHIRSRSVLEKRNPPECSNLDSLTIGKWLPKSSPLTDISQVIRGAERRIDLQCFGTALHQLQVASYDFVTELEEQGICERWEWDTLVVASYLASMRAGAFVIGDSLGQQLYYTFQYLLGWETNVHSNLSPPAYVNDKGGFIHLWRNLVLIPGTPLYNDLLPTFGAERLAQPLVTFLRVHHLGTTAQLGEWLVDFERGNSTDGKVQRVGYPYGEDPDWITVLGDADSIASKSIPGPNIPSLAIVSTGPHWGQLQFDDNINRDNQELAMLTGYSHMVNHTMEVLKKLPNIHMVFRSTPQIGEIPPSTEDNQIPSSESTRTFDRSNGNPMSLFNWPLFKKFDAIWLDAIASYSRESRVAVLDEDDNEPMEEDGDNTVVDIKTTLGGKIEWFDFGRMFGPRMDAPLKPKDGLHICLPALYEHTRVIMQHMLQEYGFFGDA